MVIVAVDFCRVFSESRSDSGRRRRGSTNIGIYPLICRVRNATNRIFEKYEKIIRDQYVDNFGHYTYPRSFVLCYRIWWLYKQIFKYPREGGGDWRRLSSNGPHPLKDTCLDDNFPDCYKKGSNKTAARDTICCRTRVSMFAQFKCSRRKRA